MQKLHGVGKFFNGWRPEPPPPPTPQKKKLVPKRKYQTEKGSLTKNIEIFMNVGKDFFFREGWEAMDGQLVNCKSSLACTLK